MAKTYCGYIRVSTAQQGTGASLAEQRAAITAFASRNDLNVVNWFVETTTAAKIGRREFTKMLASLRGGKAAGVIIHKIDRSARNLGDWARIGELVDQGIEVRFAHDDLDITTRGGRLTADIQAVIAADFIRNNREEVKKGMYGWLKRGYYPFGAPHGYINRGRHKLKDIDPVKGSIVADAFALYASGKYTIETLRRAMADRGMTRLDGRPLLKTSVSLMLRNPFYTGVIRLSNGETFDGAHVPLIAPSVFDRVQQILDGRVFLGTARNQFAFRRLIRCANCPRTLTGERQKGHIYYRCHTCPGVSLSERLIDRSIGAVLSLAFDEGEMRDVRDVVREASRRDRDGEAQRALSFEHELANVSDRLARLTDAFVDGDVDKATFNERKARLLGERVRLQERNADEVSEPFWQRAIKRFELWNTASEGYFTANDEEKRDLLFSIGSNFVAHGKELLFSADFPLTDTIKWQSVHVGAPHRCHVRIDNIDSVPRPRRSLAEIEAMLQGLEVDDKAAQKLRTSGKMGIFSRPCAHLKGAI